MSTLEISVIILVLLYCAVLMVYVYYWKRNSENDRSVSLPDVTILVPARNEVNNIAACLEALEVQDYPAAFSAIIIDDHSNDGTGDAIRKHIAGRPMFEYIDLEKADAGAGKKAALKAGITSARSEVIVTTDADCTVQKNWLRALISSMTRDVQAVTGPVIMGRSANVFEHFQVLDLLSLVLVTGGGMKGGFSILANGANMAFRKEAFSAVGGYSGNEQYASGDDLFLMHKIAMKYGRDAVVYNADSECAVRAKPLASLAQFIAQRRRWASKNRALPDQSIQGIWAFAWIVNLTVLALLVLVPLGFVGLREAVIVIAVKALFEFVALRVVAVHFDQRAMLRWFPIAFFLNLFYIVAAGVIALIGGRYTWKGRQTR